MTVTEPSITRVASRDGTELAAHTLGNGPPLVLVHGGLGHGDISFRFLLPLLAETFTCYALSTRGRGLSDDHPDHSAEALVQDVTAFVEGLDEPVAVMGHSNGGRLALAAAAQTASISAVAVYEPWLPELRAADVIARNAEAAVRISRAAAEGRAAEGAQIFFEGCALANEAELARLAEFNTADLMASTVPVSLQELVQFLTEESHDLSSLRQVTVPVLLLHGSRTHPFFTAGVCRLADELADVRVREIAGAGHLGPQLAPQPVAEALTRFLTAAHAPV